MSGLFITFEGGDGAGKTTLIDSLASEMNSQGLEVIKTREPGGSSIGKEIRDLLLRHYQKTQIRPSTEVMLFLADRVQHIEEEIRPAVEAGKIVLCDRFNDSTVAYQGYARGMGMEKIRELCDYVCEGYKPDLTFFLDLDPAIGLERVKNVGEHDRFEAERVEFHRKVREGFHKIAGAEPERFHLIDASQSVEDVFLEVLGFVKAKL